MTHSKPALESNVEFATCTCLRQNLCPASVFDVASYADFLWANKETEKVCVGGYL